VDNFEVSRILTEEFTPSSFHPSLHLYDFGDGVKTMPIALADGWSPRKNVCYLMLPVSGAWDGKSPIISWGFEYETADELRALLEKGANEIVTEQKKRNQKPGE
jgi:hypothetical protein